MITLQNDYLTVKIKEQGAEITSIVDNKTGYEFIWQADEAYWGRHAPVLFPIVGRIKDDQFLYQDETYHLTQHGFARDMTFHTQSVTSNSASLYLKNNKDTLGRYPFEFSLQINYILHHSNITISYEILNPSNDAPLYYSIGGHPAFNVKQEEQERKVEFADVSIYFEPAGQYLNIPLNKEGLTVPKKSKYHEVSEMNLTHSSFKNDALIYQISRQTEIVMNDKANGVEIRIKPNRMDFVGIWSPYPKRAPFICIEPWSGVADAEDSEGDFTHKYGINELLPSQLMTHDYTIELSKE